MLWTSRYGKARVFGTTYGHSNPTFADETFQDVVMRGMLWAAGRLGEDTEHHAEGEQNKDAQKEVVGAAG